MNDRPQNIKRSLDTLRKDVAKEIRQLKKTLDLDDASAATFLANLASVEHQLRSVFDYWNTDCMKSYRRSGAKSPLFQEADKTLKVTLQDSNEAVTGKDQNEVFVNTIIIIGLKACYEACKNSAIYAVKGKGELLVDKTPQALSHTHVREDGIDYYIYTNLSCKEKAGRLRKLEDPVGCKIHVSYE